MEVSNKEELIIHIERQLKAEKTTAYIQTQTMMVVG